MAIFSKESLETLRQRIDLVDVLSSHVDLKRSGASYKGLCPFHDERTPSFMIQKGDTHYHCFGCGAHGDAIQFLMTHLKMNFNDAVENLAQRFNVPLQVVETTQENKGPSKAVLKEALDLACRFYQMVLLHTEEGHEALQYLYQRGIGLNFIHRFRLGLAPREVGAFRKMAHAKFIKDEILMQAGLLTESNKEFFRERITFPICDAAGAVIGFSARKYKEDTFGGKYINTSETPLFKKSKVLFGLHHCRKRIAKERKALIVEGQIDALRLIEAGVNITVAGQGTAFGEGHVKELMTLGLNQVYLAMDSDEAGRQATYKIGDLFQKEGVEVFVVDMPPGSDPDMFLRQEGVEAFLEMMQRAERYISFAVAWHSQRIDVESPAGKNELVQILTKQVREWKQPLMVHETLRKIAHLLQVPEELVGVGQEHIPNVYIRKSASIGVVEVDPNRILEMDFLRSLFLIGVEDGKFVERAQRNLLPEALIDPLCQYVYEMTLQTYRDHQRLDLLLIVGRLESEESQKMLSSILERKALRERAEEHFTETMQKILDRNWMLEREEIKNKLHSAQCSDEEVLLLTKQFGQLKKPVIQL